MFGPNVLFELKWASHCAGRHQSFIDIPNQSSVGQHLARVGRLWRCSDSGSY